MKSRYTAVIQRDGACWIGWVTEVPGVKSSGKPGKSLPRIYIPTDPFGGGPERRAPDLRPGIEIRVIAGVGRAHPPADPSATCSGRALSRRQRPREICPRRRDNRWP